MENATIEVLEMSDKKGPFGMIKKIKGKDIESGRTNTYTVYDKKKDGSFAVAWEQLSNLPISVGTTVSVGYAEQDGKMPDGTPFKSRIIRNFDLDIGNGVKNAVAMQKPVLESNLKPSEGLGDDFWEQKAYKQCLWNYWLEARSKLESKASLNELTPYETDAVWQVFNQIDTDAKKRFAKGWDRAEAIFKKDLPVIQQDEEMEPPTGYGVEEIPFN